jgi:uncharacterized protein
LCNSFDGLKVTIYVVATDQKPAACVVELVSGPTAPGGIDDFELQHARRVLAQLKAAIGREGLLELLSPDIKLGVDFLREMADRSKGKLRPATTVLAVKGLTATEFLHWLDGQFDKETVMLAAEPDHFVIAPNEAARVTIVETLGEYVCQINLPPYDGAATWDAAVVDELLPEYEYQFRRIARITLPDGTLVGRMLTQFGDTPEGFNASLTAYFPTACPEDVFEHHRQHLAVEFRNWIVGAASEVRQ